VFLSTVIPGLILAVGYAILNYAISDRYCDKELLAKSPGLAPFRERMRLFPRVGMDAFPALGCPLIILVGIYGGLCTPNEAGAVACVYCLLIGFFVYRKLNRKTMNAALWSSVISIGVIGLMIAAGTLFGRFLVRTGTAQMFASFLLGLFESREMILLSMNVLILIMGMFIEAIPILILGVPLVLPVMQNLDVNLVHLGSILIVNVGLGVITPPFAMSIFVGSRLADTTYQKLVPIILRYLFFVGIPVLLLTTYIPALSCWLPSLFLDPRVIGPW
jgi:tripartite ATP-independent transporter DctM subunit